jgi:hypothetical protein
MCTNSSTLLCQKFANNYWSHFVKFMCLHYEHINVSSLCMIVILFLLCYKYFKWSALVYKWVGTLS